MSVRQDPPAGSVDRALPPDPVAPGGLAEFARGLRAGAVTAEDATAAYLKRIAILEPHLGAFAHLDGPRAIDNAGAVDRMLSSGVDLGPLMGVPMAVKDIIAVDGMPTAAGSKVDVSDIIGGQGTFIQRLRRAGCVVLGKTVTVEFAFGAGPHAAGTPWNPWDESVHRIPGGSSSGSAVAVAAGMCAFALGTDTGGSVRIPAALCGVAGLKTTHGLWPLDGVLPAAPSFDTMGLLAATAADLSYIYAAVQGAKSPPLAELGNLTLGRPRGFFSDLVDPDVEACIDAALAAAEAEGATVREIAFPEAEVARNYAIVVPTEFLSVLTRERFLAIREQLDPDVAARIAVALEVSPDRHRDLMRDRPALCRAAARLGDVDAIVTPTAPLLAVPMTRFADDDFARDYHRRITDKTRAANVLDLCAVTIPVLEPQSKLPAGLQLMCRRGEDAKALSLAQALEACLPRPEVRPSAENDRNRDT